MSPAPILLLYSKVTVWQGRLHRHMTWHALQSRLRVFYLHLCKCHRNSGSQEKWDSCVQEMAGSCSGGVVGTQKKRRRQQAADGGCPIAFLMTDDV